VQLQPLPLILDLPQGYVIQAHPGGIRIFVDGNPGARSARSIDLAPSAKTVDAAPGMKQRKFNHATLRYRTTTASGGSGGAEIHLDGVLSVGEVAYDVRCDNQAERNPPNLDFCFAAVETARPAPSRR
jgi:hypothetical protein